MDIIKFIKSVRPSITLLICIVASALAIASYIQTKEVPVWYIASFANVTGYWFAERNAKKKETNEK